MDLGGCGGVLSNGFLIHILRPELPVSVCTGVCLLYLFIPGHCVSTVESSSVQLRTRWNVPQCTNMGPHSYYFVPFPPFPPAFRPSHPAPSRTPFGLAATNSLAQPAAYSRSNPYHGSSHAPSLRIRVRSLPNSSVETASETREEKYLWNPCALGAKTRTRELGGGSCCLKVSGKSLHR